MKKVQELPNLARQPLVIVVTPSLNHARYLPGAIESVLSQGYSNLRHVVMDAGSTDGTLDILRSFGDRVLWRSEPDSGQAIAIHRGFEWQAGDIVSWLSCDDRLLPGSIRRVVEAFLSDSRPGLVYGAGELVETSGKQIFHHVFQSDFDFKALVRRNYLVQPSTFVRYDAYTAVGGLNLQLQYALDWDLFIRITKRFRAQGLAQPLSRYLLHSNSLSQTGGARYVREFAWVARLHGGVGNLTFLALSARLLWMRFQQAVGRVTALRSLHSFMCRNARDLLLRINKKYSRRIDFAADTKL